MKTNDAVLIILGITILLGVCFAFFSDVKEEMEKFDILQENGRRMWKEEQEKVDKLIESKSSEEEVLVCTQAENDSGMESIFELSFVYNNSKKEITDGSMKVTVDVGEDNIKLFEDKNLCDEYEGQEMFSSCKRIMEGTFVGADLSLDLDELEKSASDVKDFSKKMTLKELKKSIMGDSDDYECKIK